MLCVKPRLGLLFQANAIDYKLVFSPSLKGFVLFADYKHALMG